MDKTDHCMQCGVLLNQPNDPSTKGCGGDCLRCMAADDPDCAKQLGDWDAEKAFLLGLEKLTRETGIQIGGCGCCGSPFLMPVKDEELVPEAGYTHERGVEGKVAWYSPADTLWDEYGKEVVK